MKKTFIAMLIILALALICAAACAKPQEKANTYALTTKVVAIDYEKDIVTCKDYNGNLWEFYGVEDWEIGDCASLLMNDNGTAEIYDDIIENIKYSAWELN